MSLAPFSSLTFSTTLWSFYPHVLLPHHALNGLSKELEHAVWTFSFQNYEVNKFLFFIKYPLQALHCSNGKPVDVQPIRLYQCIASTALPFPSLCRDHRTVCLKLCGEWLTQWCIIGHSKPYFPLIVLKIWNIQFFKGYVILSQLQCNAYWPLITFFFYFFFWPLIIDHLFIENCCMWLLTFRLTTIKWNLWSSVTLVIFPSTVDLVPPLRRTDLKYSVTANCFF